VDLFVTYLYFMWTLCILWHLYKSMTCTCIICIVLLWLIPHPIVIWLTYGSMECNIDDDDDDDDDGWMGVWVGGWMDVVH
jgi:hypothetical protein